jgi:hypothetical protein
VTIVVAKKILVQCPYNTKFILDAKRLAGKWLSDDKVWSFSTLHEQLVRDLCHKWFGTDGTVPPDLVDVQITFSRARSENEGPVTLYGRVVASARGPDSAARLGEGVVFVEGKAFSRGDHKGWRTIVGEASVVRMTGIPRALAMSKAPPEVDVSIIEQAKPADETARLQAERLRLVARIAEIDAAMAQHADPNPRDPHRQLNVSEGPRSP